MPFFTITNRVTVATGSIAILCSFFLVVTRFAVADIPSLPYTQVFTNAWHYQLDGTTLTHVCMDRGYDTYTGYGIVSQCQANVKYWHNGLGGYMTYYGGECPDSNNPGWVQGWSITCQVPSAPQPPRYQLNAAGYSVDLQTRNRYCTEHGYGSSVSFSAVSSCDGTVNYWSNGGWHQYYGGNCPDSYNPGYMTGTITCVY